METCVLEGGVSGADGPCLDNRYFYTAGGLGQCRSGLVRRAMTAFLRGHAGEDLFVSQQSYNMIEYVGFDVSMLGFFIQQGILSTMENEGMSLNGVKQQFEVTATFDKIPKIPRDEGNSSVLYIPHAWNYCSIDANIFSLSGTEPRILSVRPIQISINQRHKNSEASFFAEHGKPSA